MTSLAGDKLHLGIIEIFFKKKSDLDNAYNLVLASKRHNFRLIILTRFVVIKKGNNLIFVYSQTRRQEINQFFKKVQGEY